jgi:hypothetical protein
LIGLIGTKKMLATAAGDLSAPGFAWSSKRTHQLVLYVAVPIVVSVICALRGRLEDKSLSVLFWVLHGLPVWMMNGVGCWALHRLLRSWRPPLLLITAVGAVIASLCSRFYVGLVFALTGDLFHGINDPSLFPSIGLTRDFASFFVQMY